MTGVVEGSAVVVGRRRLLADWSLALSPALERAAAAVFAMVPLARSVLWGPMAVAIMGGLIVATALTILAVPAIYAAWYRVRRDTPPWVPVG